MGRTVIASEFPQLNWCRYVVYFRRRLLLAGQREFELFYSTISSLTRVGMSWLAAVSELLDLARFGFLFTFVLKP